MYGMYGFAENLNIQNCENSTGNCVHYICTESLDLQKNRTSRTAKIQREIVYIICSESMDLQKIENLELQKFNGKLCTLYTHVMSGFAEKLNVQNSKNSLGNCIHYICKDWFDLQKN